MISFYKLIYKLKRKKPNYYNNLYFCPRCLEPWLKEEAESFIKEGSCPYCRIKRTGKFSP